MYVHARGPPCVHLYACVMCMSVYPRVCIHLYVYIHVHACVFHACSHDAHPRGWLVVSCPVLSPPQTWRGGIQAESWLNPGICDPVSSHRDQGYCANLPRSVCPANTPCPRLGTGLLDPLASIPCRQDLTDLQCEPTDFPGVTPDSHQGV